MEFPDLPEGSEPVDVTVRFDDIAPDAISFTNRGGDFALNRGVFYGKLRPKGLCLVKDGREIILDQVDELDREVLRAYVLTPILGSLLHQRGRLPIHASAVAGPQGAVLFCGHNGAGKSTQAAAFCERLGWRHLSDDLTLVTVQKEDYLVVPGCPTRKLWPSSFELIGGPPQEARKIYNDKFLIPNIKTFATEPVKICAIICLEGGLEGSSFYEIFGLSKLAKLREHIFFPRFLEVGGSNPGCSESMVGLARVTPLFLCDPTKQDIGVLCETIIQQLESLSCLQELEPES